MKTIATLLTLSTLCLLFIQSKSLEPTAKYYFCYSREVFAQPGTQKLKLFYTDIRTASSNEDKEIQTTIQKFSYFINKQCQSSHERCTSDLNKYYTLEEAQKSRDEILNKYKKLGTYEVSRIDFKSFE